MQQQQAIEIIDYQPRYHDDFKQLNYEWIEKYFGLEASDHQSLDRPEEQIIKPGGHIYLAIDQGEVVGTCALKKRDPQSYELVKMAVTEKAQGRGVGRLLGEVAIAKARELGGRSIFLESNTVLTPAISLYQKLGFRQVVGHPSPYERCNIQMELKLTE
jgi:N-acetylglutamate synthase-like GNAT family acetyltransferase